MGEAIADVSAPQDTIVTLPGQSNVNYAAGLASPYPHLWALPARTLDPRGRRLKRLLAGPQAPTWVVRSRLVRRTPPPGSIGAAIREHYRPVARICGATVFLRRGPESRAHLVPDPRAGRERGLALHLDRPSCPRWVAARLPSDCETTPPPQRWRTGSRESPRTEEKVHTLFSTKDSGVTTQTAISCAQ